MEGMKRDKETQTHYHLWCQSREEPSGKIMRGNEIKKMSKEELIQNTEKKRTNILHCII